MGVFESLGVDGLLSDVQRMDKRQVSSRVECVCVKEPAANPGASVGRTVFLPGTELRNDRLLCADDLEGPDGGHRQ